MYSTKEVEIKISNQNITYYKDKGYDDIKVGNTYMIKSSDVSKTVATRIYVICENCYSEKYIRSQNYHNQIKKSGFYVCINCNNVKVSKTNIIKYGTKCPLQNEIIKDKSLKTMIDNYGVDNISKVDYIKEERRNNFKSDYFIKKSKETWIKNYGVDNPSKSELIKDKKTKTLYKNYGVDNPSHSNIIFEKAQLSGKKIKKHEIGLFYRGTYEKDFLDFCLNKNIKVEKGPTIKYIFNSYNKYYHSDFYIPSINLVCEIKSSYYYNLYLEKNIQKMEYSKIHYNFLFIIDKNYNELILKIKEMN